MAEAVDTKRVDGLVNADMGNLLGRSVLPGLFLPGIPPLQSVHMVVVSSQTNACY